MTPVTLQLFFLFFLHFIYCMDSVRFKGPCLKLASLVLFLTLLDSNLLSKIMSTGTERKVKNSKAIQMVMHYLEVIHGNQMVASDYL